MANIKVKRSSVAGKVPTITDLALGEIAVNTYDGLAFIKKSVDGVESIVALGGLGGSAGDLQDRSIYIATSGQTTFSAQYSAPYVDVYLNGVLLSPSDYTATNGTSVILGTGAVVGDIVQIIGHKILGVAGTLALSGGTMTGAINFDGSQTWPTFNQNTTGSAATLTTPRTIAVTGDVAYTSAAFDGSGNVTGVATLSNSGVTAGTYGSDTNIPQLAVDSKGRVTSVTNVAVSIPSGALTFTGDVTGTGSTGATTDLTLAAAGTAGTYTKVTTDSKGRVTSGTTLVAGDIPSLDASKIISGTIDAARLPSYVDDVVEAANLAGFPATGETGKIYVALDTNKAYRWSGSTYVYITSGAVDSVAGRTGVVTLTSSDVGLGSVDNTSDAAKPVSTAQQTALNLKANLASPTFTGTVAGITKAMVGLGSVDNTSDAAKSVASAATLTTARTLTIGSTGKTFNGSANVAWTLAEIGAYAATNPSGYTTNTGTVTSVAATGGYGGLTLSGTVTTSGSLTLGGTPTGTWPISVSGNAATATSADQIDGVGFRNTDSNSGVNADTLDSNGVTYYTSGVTNFSGNASDGALYSQAYSSTWQHQIAGDYRSGQIAVRGKNSGTWQAWRTVLDSNNYNSYAPTLTGTGASGTWGISVSGNAATATTATNQSGGTVSATTIVASTSIFPAADNTGVIGDAANTWSNGQFTNLTVDSTLNVRAAIDLADNDTIRFGSSDDAYFIYNGTPNTFELQLEAAANSFLITDNGTTRFTFTKTTGDLAATSFTAANDTRAPIFYDNNDTGYYIDPNSTSDSALRMRGGALFGPNTSWGQYLYIGTNGNIDVNTATVATTNGNLHLDAKNGYVIYLNNYATSSYTVANQSIRSPIFYDLNDTSYYVDANGTSVLNRISTVRTNDWLYLDNNYGHSVVGAYSSYRYQGVFAMGDAYKLPADGTTTGNLYGMAWSHPNAGGTAANLNSHGLLLLQNGGFMAALSTNGTFSADVRGTIFYDYSNTAYYTDPASNSVLNTLQTAGHVVFGGNFSNNPYSAVASTRLMFGGGDSNAQGAYYIGTNLNNYGGNYTKLDLAWHTGIRMGAQMGYGGIRFFNSEALTTQIFSIGETDSNVRVSSALYTPITYDSNNTSYYLDPASTTNLNVLYVGGQQVTGGAAGMSRAEAYFYSTF